MDDLSQHVLINRDIITEDLQCRLSRQNPYTMCRDVCISVNPFKWLPLYTDEYINKYHLKQKLHELEPHVYLVVERAYREMYNSTQTILISGESGSGKTELTKLCINYLAAIDTNTHIQISRTLQTNAIFEFLGNAQTPRNNNSSRFGKFLELYYVAGAQVGASVRTYLFERSRVTQFHTDNAGFHIFYAVLAELGGTTCYHAGFLWQTFVDVMDKMGADASDVREIWNVIRVIIKLVDRDDKLAASLLGVDEQTLTTSFTTKTIHVLNDEIYTTVCEPIEVEERRRALSMFLYTRMFEHTVRLANRLICDNVTDTTSYDTCIGMLDIYGFESFDTNCFEQFCINYCNERLQCIFVDTVLIAQQKEYEIEGIPWKTISVYNTRDAIALCELHIIDKLDEACRLKRPPLAILAEIEAHSPPIFSRPLVQSECPGFTIEHFAETVTYAANKFMEKNIDELRVELVTALHTSNKPYIRALFPAPKLARVELWTKTIATDFKEQLHKLVHQVETTQTHHIRCIKSNEVDEPLGFDANFVARQVDYSGLVHACMIMRTEFTHHLRLANVGREFHRCSLVDLTQCHGNLHMGISRVYMNSDAYQWMFRLSRIRMIVHAFRNLQKRHVANRASRYITCMWYRWKRQNRKRCHQIRLRNAWSSWVRNATAVRHCTDVRRSVCHIQMQWRVLVQKRQWLRERKKAQHNSDMIRSARHIQAQWYTFSRSRQLLRVKIERDTQHNIELHQCIRHIQVKWRARKKRVDTLIRKNIDHNIQQPSRLQVRVQRLEAQLGIQNTELFRAKQTIMALCHQIDKLKNSKSHSLKG